jgi:molybdopterin synthase sulfur carrier subunit
MIKILYFARLREELKTESEELELDASTADIIGLKLKLSTRGGIWSEIFCGDETVMAALNQEVVQLDERLKEGDEVAFFPPVTGG